MFKVPHNHGRIFLAEQLVLLKEEYQQQKREEQSAIAVEAKKWGVSVEELTTQAEILSAVHKGGTPQVCDNTKPSVPATKQEEKECGTTGTGAATRDDKNVPIGPEGTILFSEESLLVQQQEYEDLKDQHNSQKPYDQGPSHDDQFTRNQQELNKTKEECKILQQSQKDLEEILKHRIAEHETTKRNMRTLQDTYRQVQAEKEANKAALIEKERIIAEKERLITEKERLITEKEGVIAEMKQTAENFAQSWKINHRDVTLTATELGRGGWGFIRVGVFREQRVAVKQLYHIIVSEANLAVMNREINTMSRLRHPNLLLFIGAVLDHPSGNPLVITEIMDTSLRSAYEKGQITEDSVKLSILRDTASALNYLHCHPAGAIIHRDVSSANVLLETRGTNQWRAKLSDFGSANEARKAVTKLQGAEVYAAPESFVSLLDDKEQLQTTKMDVYSYGIMVCELMTCQFPSSSTVFRSMLQSVNPTIRQVVQDCINRSPDKRPTIQQVIKSLDELINHK